MRHVGDDGRSRKCACLACAPFSERMLTHSQLQPELRKQNITEKKMAILLSITLYRYTYSVWENNVQGTIL